MITLNKYYATWCGPCKQLDPVIDQIEQEYKDVGVQVNHINIDENHKQAVEANVRSVPTVTIDKDGEEQNRIIGAKSKKRYKETLDLLLEDS